MTKPLPRPEDLSQSAAGEEDPGAGMDVLVATQTAEKKPCVACGGTGRRAGDECPACGGKGTVGVATGTA